MIRTVAFVMAGLILSMGAGQAMAGEKWKDSTGITVRTLNRNAELIRRADSRKNSFLTKDGDMRVVRGPGRTPYFYEP